jgi:hypothetical protein
VPDVVHLLQHRERGIGEWHATRIRFCATEGPILIVGVEAVCNVW